jgi:hypothetical protein
VNRFTYLASPGAVPQARRAARQALERRGLGRLAGDAKLVASELMTNAGCKRRSIPHPRDQEGQPGALAGRPAVGGGRRSGAAENYHGREREAY